MILERNTEAGVSALVRAGDPARTIVLLHGIGGNAETFRTLLAQWPTAGRVIAWDAPGYGTSTPLPMAWPQATDYAARLSALLDAVGATGPVDIVGHSLGCLVAGAFAAEFPRRVRKLVLMAPALGYRTPVGTALPPALDARIADVERLGPAAFAATRAGNLVAKTSAHTEAITVVRRAMAGVHVHGYAQAVRMLAAADLATCAARIAAPTLIINGREDAVTPPSGAQQMQAVFNARDTAFTALELIDGAGHAVSIEQPAIVAQCLTRFLAAP